MPETRDLIRWLVEPARPGLGIEFRTDEVVLARFGERGGKPELDLCLKAPVPFGVVEFSMLEPNVKESAALAAFLHKLLDQAGIRSRRVALTLPDTLARVSVVELPETPRNSKDASELLRFRLKKSLPFSTDHARVAFQPIRGGAAQFFTGVLHEEVVSQYEQLLEGLGFHVGVVEIASLSLLNLWHPVVKSQLPAESDYFFLNIEEQYFSVILVRNGMPFLVRTLGSRAPVSSGSGGSYQIGELVREIVPTLIYYREKLGGSSPSRVYYRSLRPDFFDLNDVLETQFETPAEPFDLHQAVTVGENLNVEAHLASVVGAAAGAALGKAA